MSTPPPKARLDIGHDSESNVDFSETVTHGFEDVSTKGTGTKPDDTLSVTYTGNIRAPSPNPSLLSDEGVGRLGRREVYLGVQDSRRHASRSPAPPARTTKEKLKAMWKENLGLVLVLISQFFGTLMNVTTRMLEIEGNNGKGYHPFQILFARMSITVVCSTWYMWRSKTKDFPFGLKEVQSLLVARGLFGFFGVFGMYCMTPLLQIFTEHLWNRVM